MKSKIVLSFLICALSTLSYSQTNRLGFVWGSRLSNVKNGLEGINTYLQSGWLGGITYEHEFANKLTFSSDLVLYKAGFLLKQDFTDEYGNLRLNQEIPFTYYYVGIPLRIGYSKGDKFFWTTKAGICPAMILFAKYLTPGGTVNGFQQATYHHYFQSEIKQFDINAILEIGGGVKMGNRVRLKLDLVGMFSFMNHTPDDFYKGYRSTLFGSPSHREMRHYGFGINVGIDFKLGAL